MSEVGDQLRRAREAKNLALANAASVTCIKACYLQALEEGRWDDLPGAIQLRGFLKNYATFLGLDGDELVTCREREAARPAQAVPQPAAVRVEPPQPAVLPEEPAAARVEPPQPAAVRAVLPEEPAVVRVEPPQQPAAVLAAPPEPAGQLPREDLQVTQAPASPEPAPVSFEMRLPLSEPLDASQEALPALEAPGLPQLETPPAPPGAQPAAEMPAQAGPSPRASSPEQFLQPPPWLSLDILMGGIGLVLFVVLAILVVRSFLFPLATSVASPPSPTGLAVTLPDAISPTPTAGATPTPVFPANPNGGLQVGLAAGEHVWVRVTTDGLTAFEGLLAPSQALFWDAKEQLIVETGNGAALNLTINDRAMGMLGARNQVAIRAWSPLGEVVPPATPTPLPPTETPEPPPTPLPTLAP